MCTKGHSFASSIISTAIYLYQPSASRPSLQPSAQRCETRNEEGAIACNWYNVCEEKQQAASSAAVTTAQ
eukprot:scaffold131100_cov97-Cyclotella_meneghiniana.AAC.2